MKYTTTSKQTYVFALIALCGWLWFLFIDNILPQNSTNNNLTHYSPNAENNGWQITEPLTPPLNTINVQESIIDQEAMEDISDQLSISQENIGEFDIDEFQVQKTQSLLEDINILEKIYKKNPKPEILRVLIEKLSQDYQFEKAKDYADLLIKTKTWFQMMDPYLYMYIALNHPEISILRASSIESIRPIIDEWRMRGVLSMDDYRFYQGLIQVWYGNYPDATILFKQISSPRYQPFLDQLEQIKANATTQEDIPPYYEEALIGLAMLKHGQFNIAKKISLNVLEQDDEYILPYQILAYSHFLTNNRNTAVEYLFKLSEFDHDNEVLYKFLIWVSYYRLDKNEQSVLYLSQIENDMMMKSFSEPQKSADAKKLLPDTYRYMILNYLKTEDSSRTMQIRQKMLWQPVLESSDFYTQFYNVLFLPFIQWSRYDLYAIDPQLINDYIQQCYERFPIEKQDVCIYGEAGYELLQWESEQAKDKLLYLAKNYPTAYIFHTLGDYYYQVWQNEKAKRNYIKAISITDNTGEELVLKRKLTEYITQF